MISDFLKRYTHAITLDDKKYDQYFRDGVNRSDFILFAGKIVCETKEITSLNVPHKIESLAFRTSLSEQDFKRELYNTINNALRKANKQIIDTKAAMSLPNAYGLVILENIIPSHFSILSLLDASNRKMISGLSDVDAVLCCDFVNTFIGHDNTPVQPVQAIMRLNKGVKCLSNLIEQVVASFCKERDIPFQKDFNICNANQRWFTTSDGTYETYKAHVTFDKHQSRFFRLVTLHARWGWLIALLVLLVAFALKLLHFGG